MSSEDEKISDKLSRLFPLSFGKQTDDVELLSDCYSLFDKIQARYNIECNPTITRGIVKEIESLMVEIQNYKNPLNNKPL